MLPDPVSLDYAKLLRERDQRRTMLHDCTRAARSFGRTQRERLRIAIERVEHEKLLRGGFDQKLFDRMRIAARLARARRDAKLPKLPHEAKMRTRRRRRAKLELELWK